MYGKGRAGPLACTPNHVRQFSPSFAKILFDCETTATNQQTDPTSQQCTCTLFTFYCRRPRPNLHTRHLKLLSREKLHHSPASAAESIVINSVILRLIRGLAAAAALLSFAAAKNRDLRPPLCSRMHLRPGSYFPNVTGRGAIILHGFLHTSARRRRRRRPIGALRYSTEARDSSCFVFRGMPEGR